MATERITDQAELVAEPGDNFVFVFEGDEATPVMKKVKYATLKTYLAGIAAIATGGLLWVDAVNGDNGTAIIGRLDKPYSTLGAAKTAASSGSTIIVLPGTYSADNNLAKDGVNWCFFPGAIVNYAGSDSNAIFEVTTETFSVTGMGEFENSGSGGGGVISITDNAELSFYAKRIESSSGSCYSHVVPASTAYKTIRLDVEQILGNDASNACIYVDHDTGPGWDVIKADLILQSEAAAPIMKVAGLNLFISARQISNIGGKLVENVSGKGMTGLRIKADNITGGALVKPVDLTASPSFFLGLDVKEISGGNTGFIRAATSGSLKLFLWGTSTYAVGVVDPGDYFVEATGTATIEIYAYGNVTSNVGVSSGVTFVVGAQRFEVNSETLTFSGFQ